MDILHLRYFLTMAEMLNYTRAAEQLYISRQALRQSMAAMEKEFGVALFHNERNKLSLTEAGEYLLVTSREIVPRFDEMLEGMYRIAKQEVELTVAMSGSLFPFMMPEADGMIKRFQARHPSVRLKVLPMTNDQVMEALEQGQIDCGCVIQMPCHRPGIRMETITTYRTVISYGQSHPLAGREIIGLEDLQGYHCLGMGSMAQTMRPVYESCQARQIQLQYEVAPDAIEVFYRIVRDGAVAFDIYKEDIPEYSRGYYSLLEGYQWEIGILHREQTSMRREVQIFCDFLKEEYEKMKQEQRISGILPPPAGVEMTR